MDNHSITRQRRTNPRRGRVLCRYFTQGYCFNGDACQFSHEDPGDSAMPGSESSPKVPCRYFARGDCNQGDACPFAHEESPRPSPATEEVIFDENTTSDDWTRELRGVIVNFADGGAVSKVSTPWDSSAVRLDNVPRGSSPASVAALLSSLGLVVTADDVRVTEVAGATNCSAIIMVDDPMFAKRVCDTLRGSAAAYASAAAATRASFIEAVPIPVLAPRGSSLHLVDCKRVQCSWHRPTRTAYLDFGAKNVAQEVLERFNSGAYSVPGCHVKAKAPPGEWDDCQDPLAWTVMLTDLLDTVTEEEIRQAISPSNPPHRVVMGRPTYDGVEHFGSSIVKSMLLQFGLLERWEVFGVRSTGRRVRARARFWEESHAREAVSLLDNKRLSFTGNGRLSVRLLISTKFKISARIYDALQEPLGLQTPLWERQFLKFVAYPPHKGYRVLKLEGEDKELVSQAKKTLEQIVGGEVVRKGGQTIWSASLGGNGVEYKRLKELERIHGVAIMRDRQKSQLRLFGPERAYGRVTDAIAALVQATQDGNPDSQPIVLSSDAFQWACRGGFQALATRLGNNKATFDIVSTPKRILIRGSKADYIAALDIMVNRKSGPVKPRSDAQTECSVCWGEAEDPIRTSCDHVYCPDCFSDMCRATSSKTTEHRICCVGGQGSCDKVVPLWELQELLSSADFEEVLEGSFASYIRRHPADFQYCSTPDCGQIYRVAASESAASSMIITCPQCMMPTCTSCHSAHPGMTCAEYKYRAGGGDEALERVKKELGAKDCPRCKTMMEKTGGCNHIMCRGCGIHMCWICLATFDTGAACYDHLGRTHQRIFDLD